MEAIGVNSLHEPAGFTVVADATDSRARQQAALLAFGRRTTAPPAYGILLQDAITLLIDACEVEYGLFGELAADHRKFIIRTEVRQSAINSGPFEIPDVGSQSLADYTLETGRPCVAQDLATDQRFKDLALRRLGIVSAAAVPLEHLEQRFGVLVLGTTKPKKMTNEDLAFFEAVSHLLATAIAREKIEQILTEERLMMTSLCDALPDMVLMLDKDGKILHTNRACQEISRFDLHDLIGRPLWNALAAPDCAAAMQAAFDKTFDTAGRLTHESCLVTKDNVRRPVVWTHTTMHASRVLVTGTVQEERSAALHTQSATARPASRSSFPQAPANDAGIHNPAGNAPDAAPAAQAASDPTDRRTGRERRASERRTFPFQQRVAPYHGSLPSDDEFFMARFSDISAGGVSFILDEKPAYTSVVIELGTAPRISKIIADIVRVIPSVEDGRQVHLIGCRFVQRL